MLESFYAACADYSAWQAAASASQKEIFPFGADTAAAYDAFCVLDAKVKDYFYRCKLRRYDETAAAAVDVKVEKLEDLSGGRSEASERMRAIYGMLDEAGIASSFVFDPSITRGLDYYTGLVYETFLDKLPSLGSVCSGAQA